VRQTKIQLLIGTRNTGKFDELSALLSKSNCLLLSLNDLGLDAEVEETGSSFEENAALKAREYSQLSGLPTLADDSGLEVDVLGGEPGILSSRYAGPGATDTERIAFLLQRLDNIPEKMWLARFRCAVAIVFPKQQVEIYLGECEGRIISKPRGLNGFGYDPVFVPEGLDHTMAELSAQEKNDISHRSLAVRKASEALAKRA